MDRGKSQNTYFAPAARMSSSQIDDLVQRVINEPVVTSVLKSIDGFVVLLNTERQILAANENILEFLGIDPSELLGKRPGEALDCIHHKSGPGGCGTSKHCANCGAVLTILASQSKNEPVDGECWLTRKVGDTFEAAEFRVRSTPLHFGSRTIWAFVLHDISSSKRKEVLERIFIHDLMNILGGLQGYIELWKLGIQDDFQTSTQKISKLVSRLHSEISSHRVLLEAERGQLEVNSNTIAISEILRALESIFTGHDLARDRNINISTPKEECFINSDDSLILRVLSNMLTNALEATCNQGAVEVWFEKTLDGPTFFARNEGALSKKVSLQVFQRSFSTKGGQGRGLGTYSMKLIGEKYLNGKVGFNSTEEDGTVFFITLPNETIVSK